MKYKIVFFISGLGSGGAEGALCRLLLEFKRRGFVEFKIYVLKPKRFFEPILLQNNITVDFLDLNWNPFRFFKTTTRVLRELRMHKPCVSSWLYHSDIYGGILAKLAGVKYIYWSIRQTNISMSANSFQIWLLIRVCAFLSKAVPTSIVSCSNSAAVSHTAIGYPRSKVHIIPNGFDLDLFPTKGDLESKIENCWGQTRKIIHVGRRDPQKNHQLFFAAASQLIEAGFDFVFICIGDGVEGFSRSPYFEEFTNLSLDENIFLHNEIEDVFGYISEASCLVQTSIGEGFPNVVAESCLLGTPVIASDVGDTSNILGSSEWLVSAHCSPSELADKILTLHRLTKNECKKFILRQRTRIEKQYSITTVADKFLRIFDLE